MKDTLYHRHEFARLYVNVTRVNDYAPVIESSTGSFTGYMLENAPIDTLVLNSGLNASIKLNATDPDAVSYW